jgi:two-component system, response regulator RegA
VGATAANSVHPFRLLIVEDDDTFRGVLVRALSRRGFEVQGAATAAEGLGAVARWAPHGAVVDLRLPDESGLALVPKLLAVLPEIHVVVLTGYASVATAVEAIKQGAVHYLAKPAEVDDIVTALDLLPRFEGGERPARIAEQPLSVDRLEWEHIQKVLLENDGNVSATARVLNMHRRTLQRKLGKRPPKT